MMPRSLSGSDRHVSKVYCFSLRLFPILVNTVAGIRNMTEICSARPARSAHRMADFFKTLAIWIGYLSF